MIVPEKYRRLDGEGIEDYELRICELNEATGELERWQDIADLVNLNFGTDFSECKVRKDYSQFKRMLPAYLKRHGGENSSEAVERLKELQLDLRKEKQQLYDQRREINNMLRPEARMENLLQTVERCAASLNKEFPLLGYETINVSHCTDKEAVLVLSDWHYGMVTDNIWNTYNVEVCKHRVAFLLEQVKEKLLLHEVSTLHILLLGDAAHGSIHVGARVASEEDACDQLMHVAELIAEFTKELLNYVPIIKVHENYGNHMRTVQNKKDSIHSDNMEKIIAWWLKQRFLGCKCIEFPNSRVHEFNVLNVHGYNIVAVHGDLEKGFGQIPVTMGMVFGNRLGVQVDYVISADKHHLEGCDKFGVQGFLAPSLCGTDDYANGLRAYSRPSQLLMIFGEYGLDSLCNICLDAEPRDKNGVFCKTPQNTLFSKNAIPDERIDENIFISNEFVDMSKKEKENEDPYAEIDNEVWNEFVKYRREKRV